MATVETVTGPIEADELGTTLIHEHLRDPRRGRPRAVAARRTSGEDPPSASTPGDGYEAAVEVGDARRSSSA